MFQAVLGFRTSPISLRLQPKVRAYGIHLRYMFDAKTFAEMDEGELLFTDGFELQDAMTAFEVSTAR